MLSDDELLAAITRDLRAIYADVIRKPLPDKLAAALARLDQHQAPTYADGSPGFGTCRSKYVVVP